MEQQQSINDYTKGLFDNLVFDLEPGEFEGNYGDNSLLMNLAAFGEELPPVEEQQPDYEMPNLHEYIAERDETQVSQDIKDLPLIARLGILGAKIREDPTSWYYFCACKNSMIKSHKTFNSSTKYVDLAARNKDEAVMKFQTKAHNIEKSVETEANGKNMFSAIAQYALDDVAYVNSTYAETIRKNCMRLVSSESTIDTTGIPYSVQIEKANPKFPFVVDRTNVAYGNYNCNASHAVELRDDRTNRRYQYFSFNAGNTRDIMEFSSMLKRSDWPNLLWRENRAGVINEHYLLPISSPATFKTWIFLQQYYKANVAKQKIDKFSIQNYAAKFDYSKIDFLNWYGPHSERKNLDGSDVCAAYRIRYFKHGKYVEPNNVPLVLPNAMCRMRDKAMCTCFIYPGELLDNMQFAQEIVLQNGKYVKKPVRTGKICFYCTSRYYGDRCEHPDHAKNLTSFVRVYSNKYKIDALVTRSDCVSCRIILRVENDGRRRPVYSNELVVTPDFFTSQHWIYIQSAYANGTIYVVNYPGPINEVLKSVDQDNNLRVEFLKESVDESASDRYSDQLKPAICPKKRCDKLMNMYINDKIASIIGSTCQPLQFPEGYVLTLVPTKSMDSAMDEAMNQCASNLSIYNPNMQESVLKDHRKREENFKLKQANQLFGAAKKRRHDEDDLVDETNGAKQLKIVSGQIHEETEELLDIMDDAINNM